MHEIELKKKIQLLYAVKPRDEWVFLTRTRLFGSVKEDEINGLQKYGFSFIMDFVRFARRPAFAMPFLALMVAIGAVWQTSITTLPGDKLYGLKAAAERIPFAFFSQDEKPFREFDLAQQRLADLKVIAEQNKVKNLPSAIQEFEAKASRVSEEFVQIVENQPEKALQASQKLVELQKEKFQVEQILGTKIGEQQEDEIDNTIKRLVIDELAYLETRSLTEDQEELFESAQALVEKEDYAAALEIIWSLSQEP